MSKLHEILAVEGDLNAVQQKVIEEGISTFRNRQAHFIGRHQVWEMFDEDRVNETPPEAFQKLTTTVADKLAYIQRHVSSYFDAIYQKEHTNQSATGDIILDGVTVASDIPVTLLVGLEKRLVHMRELYTAIPTLPPAFDWEKASDLGDNVYKNANVDIKNKTEKTLCYKILADATDKHPARIETWHEDKPIGRSKTKTWSGMITTAEKSAILWRLDKLIQAIKQARQRANETEIETGLAIGDLLLNYIHGRK